MRLESFVRRGGVRTSTTVVAVLVVGTALVLGAIAFVFITRDRIVGSIADAAAVRTDALVAQAGAGALTDPLPGRDPEVLAQLVDGSGSVIAADRAVAGLDPLTGPVAVGERIELRVDGLFEGSEGSGGPEDEGPYLVVAEGVALESGPGTVVVVASLEDASEALWASAPLLWVGLPALVVLVGVTTWWLTGRALRPVEAMRSEARLISAAAFDRRLPIPDSRDEIHRLAVTLNEMLDRLEESAVRQRRFVADASHELRSPLAALRVMVEVGDDESAGRRPELARDMDMELGRMQRLVDDLLYLARSGEAPVDRRMVEVELDRIVLGEASSLAQRSGLHPDVTGVVPVRMVGDPEALARLVRNLLDNAAGHGGRSIWLETRAEQGTSVLVIDDDGPGIPPADRGRVFERFVRLDESRARDTGGAGLGLAVARAVALGHHGDLRVVEPRHGGASLEARFPSLIR